MASVTDLEARAGELRTELKDIDAANDGDMLSGADQERWNAAAKELEAVEATLKQLVARKQYLEEMSRSSENIESEDSGTAVYTSKRRVGSRLPDDLTRFEDYRTNASNLDDLNQLRQDGALKLLDRKSFQSAHPSVSKEEAQSDIERVMKKDPEIADRVIFTSSPEYRREFAAYCQTGAIGPNLMRTSSLTTTAGGFAVPVELDTSLILTNAGVVNPIRNLARVRQTNVNTYEFINSTGIVAGFGAEATEASDNAPTLQQPTVNIEKAFAFVPMSIEISQDWANIQEDMALCFADAKNQLESSKFLTGLGHASHEPQGLIAAGGATSIVTTGTTAVVGAADLYALRQALSERYQPNASIVGNRATFDKIRQLDTAGGANLWVQLSYDNPPTLLGYPAYMWSKYDNTPTTSGSTVLTIGDFSYFKIIDRAGLSVELIPHMFATANNLPSGQRGLYMYWRNTSQVVSPTLGAYSAFQSLKVL